MEFTEKMEKLIETIDRAGRLLAVNARECVVVIDGAPRKVMNALFELMDFTCEEFKVYKVEYVGKFRKVKVYLNRHCASGAEFFVVGPEDRVWGPFEGENDLDALNADISNAAWTVIHCSKPTCGDCAYSMYNSGKTVCAAREWTETPLKTKACKMFVPDRPSADADAWRFTEMEADVLGADGRFPFWFDESCMGERFNPEAAGVDYKEALIIIEWLVQREFDARRLPITANAELDTWNGADMTAGKMTEVPERLMGLVEEAWEAAVEKTPEEWWD